MNTSEPLVDSLRDLLTQVFVLEPVLRGVHLVRVVEGAEDVVSFLLLTSVTGLFQLRLLGVLLVSGGKFLNSTNPSSTFSLMSQLLLKSFITSSTSTATLMASAVALTESNFALASNSLLKVSFSNLESCLVDSILYQLINTAKTLSGTLGSKVLLGLSRFSYQRNKARQQKST